MSGTGEAGVAACVPTVVVAGSPPRLPTAAAPGSRLTTAICPPTVNIMVGETTKAAASRLNTATAKQPPPRTKALMTAGTSSCASTATTTAGASRIDTAASKPTRTAVLTTAGTSSYASTRLATAAGSNGPPPPKSCGGQPPPTNNTTYSVAHNRTSGLAGSNPTHISSKDRLQVKKRRMANKWWKSFGRPAPRIGIHGESVFKSAEPDPELDEPEEEVAAELLVLRPRSRSAGSRQSTAEIRMQFAVLKTENAVLRSKLEAKQAELEEASSAAATVVEDALAEALKGDEDESAGDPEEKAAEHAARLQKRDAHEAARRSSAIAAARGGTSLEEAIESGESAAARVNRWYEAAAMQREMLGLNGGGAEAEAAILCCMLEDDSDQALNAAETTVAANAATVAAVNGVGAGAARVAALAAWHAHRRHKGPHATAAAMAAGRAASDAAEAGSTGEATLLIARAAALATSNMELHDGPSREELQAAVIAIGVEMTGSGAAMGSGADEAIVQAAAAAATLATSVSQIAADKVAQAEAAGSGSNSTHHPEAEEWARKVASQLALSGSSHAICLLGAQAFVAEAMPRSSVGGGVPGRAAARESEVEELVLEAALSTVLSQLSGKHMEPRKSATPEQVRDEMRILDGMKATVGDAVAAAVRLARAGVVRAGEIARDKGCSTQGVEVAMQTAAKYAGAVKNEATSSVLVLDAAVKAAVQASCAGRTAREADVAAMAAAEVMVPDFMEGALVAGKHAAEAMAAGSTRLEAVAVGIAAAVEHRHEESTEASIRAATEAAAKAAKAAFLKASSKTRTEAASRLVAVAAAAAAAAVRTSGHIDIEAAAAAVAVVEQGIDAAAASASEPRLLEIGAVAAVRMQEQLRSATTIARASMGVSEIGAELLDLVAAELQRGTTPALAAVACMGKSVAEVAGAAGIAKLTELEQRPPEAAATAAMVVAKAIFEEVTPAVAFEAGTKAAAAVAEALSEPSLAEISSGGDALAAAEMLTARLEAAVSKGVSRGADAISEVEGQLSMPAWGLESWLHSLDFNKVLCDALLKRVRAKTGGATDPRQELAFVTHLGKASPSVVEALLEESGVMPEVAQAIWSSAEQLYNEMKEIREAEAKRLRAEKDRKRKAIQARRRFRAGGLSARVAIRPLIGRIQGLRDGDQLAESEDPLTSKTAEEPAVLTAEQLNQQFAENGAITLFYSNDNELFWQGLNRVVGKCADGIEEPLFDTMKREHCEAIDSEAQFEATNHAITTTSKIEWWFVADPTNGLEALGIEQWPPHRWDWERRADPKEHYSEVWQNEINNPLVEQGEKPLGDEEFIALRLYTGPMFVKYNGLLRGTVSTVPFLQNMAKKLCQGNMYPTTIHTLSAAIIKLSKLQSSCHLYRAPGGALPKPFWREPRGGIEPAFMSTTTNREEAMHYARRSPSKILFEVQQGMVARGASVSWLSQYPTEEEIIFPPLTVLEVTGMRVDGTIIIAEVSPSVPKPSAATGDEDAIRQHEEKLKMVSDMEAAMAEAHAAQVREAETRHLAEKTKWKSQMTSFISATRDAQATSMKIAAEEARRSSALSEAEKAEKMRLLEEKEASFAKATGEAQSLVDKAAEEAAHLEEKVTRERTALVENMRRSRLQRQQSMISSSFGVKMLQKKHTLDRAKAARSAGEGAAAAAAEEAYAKAQAEFEEATRLAAEEAEATISDLREKCKTIIAKENITESIGKLPTNELVKRLQMFIKAKNGEGVEVAVETVLKRVKEEPPKPGAIGRSNARVDVTQDGGLGILVSCIGYAIERASTPASKGGEPAGKLLDNICNALAFVLQQEGNDAKAVQEGALDALAQAINHQMSSGLKSVQAIAKDEGTKARALKAGIRKDWLSAGD